MTEQKTSEDAAAKLLEDKQVELDKANKRVENAETKFSQWSNELGAMRTSHQEMKDTLTEAQKTIEELKKVAEKNKDDTTEGKKVEVEADTLEKTLNDDQRKVGLESFNSLTDEQKIQYEKDPSFRKAFLERLTKAAPVVPVSPWKTTTKKAVGSEDSEYDKILDRVFDRKKRSGFVPAGPNGGVTRMVNGQPVVVEPQEDSRVH